MEKPNKLTITLIIINVSNFMETLKTEQIIHKTSWSPKAYLTPTTCADKNRYLNIYELYLCGYCNIRIASGRIKSEKAQKAQNTDKTDKNWLKVWWFLNNSIKHFFLCNHRMIEFLSIYQLKVSSISSRSSSTDIVIASAMKQAKLELHHEHK